MKADMCTVHRSNAGQGVLVMKTLVVMRHGKAMPPAPGQQDIDRTLTEAGVYALEERLPRMLRLLETRGTAVQIWTSPAKRARQTAELLEKALEERGVEIDEKMEAHECLWDQDVNAFLDELRLSDAEFVFAVGHIPFAEDVVEELTDSTPAFSTGALACLELQLVHEDSPDTMAMQDKAKLLWFAQGPVAADWDTLVQLQKAITKTAEVIEDRRAAFFADPKDIETIHCFRTNIRTLRSLIAFIKPWQDKEENAEVQALLCPSVYGSPRWTAVGMDVPRFNMLLAVLERRAGLRLSDKDAYLSVAGSLHIQDRSADLAAILCVASACYDKPVPLHTAAIGEVGLTGDVRPVGQMAARLKECLRLGYASVIVPEGTKTDLPGLKLIHVKNVLEASSLIAYPAE